MNKREAKYRAINLCVALLKKHIDDGSMVDMVDDDTTDDEAERIIEQADNIRFSLQKRAEKLERAA